MTFSGKMKRAFTAFKTAFYRGPSWLAGRDPERGGYISPTYMICFWLFGLSERTVTAQGRMFLAAYMAIAFYSTVLTRSPAVTFFLALTFMMLFNAVMLIIFFPRIKTVRTLPARVTADAVFKISYRIENKSAFPCFDLIPDSLLRMRSLETDPPPRLQLGKRETLPCERSFKLTKRGIYRFPSCVTETGFPFNIFRAGRCDGTTARVICHPLSFILENLRLPDGSSLKQQNTNSVSFAGQSMDLYGCREYRPGDDQRKIHWLASARRNKLVVKEFQEERLSRAAVILDTRAMAETSDWSGLLLRLITLKPLLTGYGAKCFEAAVTLSASIVETLSKQNFALDIFAAGSELHHFKAGRGGMTPEAFMDILASLESSPSPERFGRLTPSDISEIASVGAVFMILVTPDPEAKKLYDALLKSGASVRAFSIGSRGSCDWTENLDPDPISNGKPPEI